MENWRKRLPIFIKEGLYEKITDDKGTRVLGYENCSDKVVKFIEQKMENVEKRGIDKLKRDIILLNISVGVALIVFMVILVLIIMAI